MRPPGVRETSGAGLSEGKWRPAGPAAVRRTLDAKAGQKGRIVEHRIYAMSFARVYPLYIAKVERKGRTKAEVDEVIRWMTGYSDDGLAEAVADGRDFRRFFAEAPNMNPARERITGTVCGVRVQEVEEPLMREIRYLDLLVDEIARGKAMEKILRA